ncbi:MAG: histidine kinase [Ignavibacteriaceae bacterium]|nr:histidine kinase [Ignavibacteriaceae bacterium]
MDCDIGSFSFNYIIRNSYNFYITWLFMHDFIKDRNKLYWLLQVLGWGLYILFNIFVSISYEGYDWRRLLLFLYIGLMGIGFTHVFRVIIKSRHWIQLSLKELIPRVVLSNIFTAFVIVTITFSILFASDIYKWETFRFIVFAMNMFNFTVILLLWSFIYFAIHYFENYKTSEIERLIWEAAVKDFELKTLKSQLNPHFMFNALNSIRALVEENPERAKISITQLSNIFRYSLGIERTETVPLDDEMKAVQDYLSLEKVRYEERLNYKISISPDTKNIEIPPMMIQTLTENGIKHGISKYTEGGIIEIETKRDVNKLFIQIKNNGNVREEDIINSKGYGISNTKQRLNLLYGDKASFKIKNENGFVVTEIIIPIGG